MEYTLVKWRDNYGDEFDVESFDVREGGIEAVKKELAAVWSQLVEDGEYDHYIGTNEFITYTSVEGIADKFSFIPLTQTQADFVRGTFGRRRAMDFPE